MLCVVARWCGRGWRGPDHGWLRRREGAVLPPGAGRGHLRPAEHRLPPPQHPLVSPRHALPGGNIPHHQELKIWEKHLCLYKISDCCWNYIILYYLYLFCLLWSSQMFCIDPGRGLIPVWIPASVRCQAEAKLHIKPIQQIGYRG